jgi:hypothetical protein
MFFSFKKIFLYFNFWRETETCGWQALFTPPFGKPPYQGIHPCTNTPSWI